MCENKNDRLHPKQITELQDLEQLSVECNGVKHIYQVKYD